MPKQRIFKTKTFNKWMIKSDLSDSDIQSAVEEMKNGLIDANLGGNVFKKRVALSGRGKSSSARTIVASRLSNYWFFMYGFNKNEKSNIDKTELRYFQELAKTFLDLNSTQLNIALNNQELWEITNGDN
jgi:hypothetical protein